LTGATVELQPLGRKLVTDANGLYTFRDLPPGDYTVVASHDRQEHLVVVTVPVGPAFMKDIDVAVVPRGDVIAENRAFQNRTLRARAIAIDARSERTVSAEPRDSKPASPLAGSFTIQVAASANLRHARAMVSELRGGGHAAYLVGALPGDGARHHVRVGHYATLSEADRAAGSLERALGWRLRVTTDVAPHSSTSLIVHGTAVSP
jgi:cell division septation protein DedD